MSGYDDINKLIEVDDKKNKELIEIAIKEAKEKLEEPFIGKVKCYPTPLAYTRRPSIFERIWKIVYKIYRWTCNAFWKAYRTIRYWNIASVPVVENGLVTIPLDRVTDKNAGDVNNLVKKISRTDNLGRGMFCIRHKAKRRVVIEQGTFESLRTKYGDEYEIVESEIK